MTVAELTREAAEAHLVAANATLDAMDRTVVRMNDEAAIATLFATRLLVLRERMTLEQFLGV